MDQNLDNKTDLKNRIVEFYNSNKIKIFISIFAVIIAGIFMIFSSYKNEQKNKFMSEKYIQARLYLTSNKKDDAKALLEEIILSKNEFYSLLALNMILEKKLILEKNKMLEYFEILEKNSSSKHNKDLVIFKKSLFLIKEGQKQNGMNLLKKLIENDSALKPIIQGLFDN